MNTAKQVGGALGLAALIALADGQNAQHSRGMDHQLGFLGMAAILLLVAALAFALPSQRDAENTLPAR